MICLRPASSELSSCCSGRLISTSLIPLASFVGLDAGILDARRLSGLADLVDIRSLLKLHLHLSAALESPRRAAPGCRWCAQCMPIEMMPATLKINEKARKYHFSLSQSTFTPRNNSTASLRFLGGWSLCRLQRSMFPCSAVLLFPIPCSLNRHQFPWLQLVQVGIEDDPRDKDRREQVGQPDRRSG
jgi:hypothetical protein